MPGCRRLRRTVPARTGLRTARRRCSGCPRAGSATTPLRHRGSAWAWCWEFRASPRCRGRACRRFERLPARRWARPCNGRPGCGMSSGRGRTCSSWSRGEPTQAPGAASSSTWTGQRSPGLTGSWDRLTARRPRSRCCSKGRSAASLTDSPATAGRKHGEGSGPRCRAVTVDLLSPSVQLLFGAHVLALCRKARRERQSDGRARPGGAVSGALRRGCGHAAHARRWHASGLEGPRRGRQSCLRRGSGGLRGGPTPCLLARAVLGVDLRGSCRRGGRARASLRNRAPPPRQLYPPPPTPPSPSVRLPRSSHLS